MNFKKLSLSGGNDPNAYNNTQLDYLSLACNPSSSTASAGASLSGANANRNTPSAGSPGLSMPFFTDSEFARAGAMAASELINKDTMASGGAGASFAFFDRNSQGAPEGLTTTTGASGTSTGVTPEGGQGNGRETCTGLLSMYQMNTQVAEGSTATANQRSVSAVSSTEYVISSASPRKESPGPLSTATPSKAGESNTGSTIGDISSASPAASMSESVKPSVAAPQMAGSLAEEATPPASAPAPRVDSSTAQQLASALTLVLALQNSALQQGSTGQGQVADLLTALLNQSASAQPASQAAPTQNNNPPVINNELINALQRLQTQQQPQQVKPTQPQCQPQPSFINVQQHPTPASAVPAVPQNMNNANIINSLLNSLNIGMQPPPPAAPPQSTPPVPVLPGMRSASTVPTPSPQMDTQQLFAAYGSSGSGANASNTDSLFSSLGFIPSASNSVGMDVGSSFRERNPSLSAGSTVPTLQTTNTGTLTSLEMLRGQILNIVKDHDGFTQLQGFLDTLYTSFKETAPGTEQRTEAQRRLSANMDILIDELFCSNEVILNVNSDAFGNYLVQKMINIATPAQIATIVERLRGQLFELATQGYAYRVVNKLIECLVANPELPSTLLDSILNEVAQSVCPLSEDQYGNHVVQLFIQLVPDKCDFIIKAFRGHVRRLATHAFCCRVLQCLIKCKDYESECLVDELFPYIRELIFDRYGNYVIQFILKNCRNHTSWVSKIFESVKCHFYDFSKQKIASNVMEEVYRSSSLEEKTELFAFLCNPDPNHQLNKLSASGGALMGAGTGMTGMQQQPQVFTGQDAMGGSVLGAMSSDSASAMCSSTDQAFSGVTSVPGSFSASATSVSPMASMSDPSVALTCMNASRGGAQGGTYISYFISMMMDRFANYVAQKMVEETNSAALRDAMVAHVSQYIPILSMNFYARHIIAKYERCGYFAAAAASEGGRNVSVASKFLPQVANHNKRRHRSSSNVCGPDVLRPRPDKQQLQPHETTSPFAGVSAQQNGAGLLPQNQLYTMPYTNSRPTSQGSQSVMMPQPEPLNQNPAVLAGDNSVVCNKQWYEQMLQMIQQKEGGAGAVQPQGGSTTNPRATAFSSLENTGGNSSGQTNSQTLSMGGMQGTSSMQFLFPGSNNF